MKGWASNPNLWGPVYSFVGAEFFFFIVAVIVWLVWTVWQIRYENANYDRESAALRQGDNLRKAVGEYQAATRSFFGD
jgi:hypothetical protein